MICVKTYYNTDEHGKDVPEDVELEDMPITLHGPFDTLDAAVTWITDVYPDGGTDVYEQIADDFDLPEGTYINDPNSLFSQH